jgi:hypothetical protein
MFGFLSLVTLTFDADSLITPTTINLRLPHDDRLWSCNTENQWKSFPTEQPPVYSETISSMLSGEAPAQIHQRYIFGGLSLIYGIHTELHQCSGRAQTLSNYQGTQPTPEWSAQIHAALNSCHNFLASNLPEHKHSLTNSERRMLFTCNTLLRLGSFRVFTQLGMPQIKFGSPILAAFATYDDIMIDKEIEKFNSIHLKRCPERTAAARLAVDRLKLPLGLGYAILSRFGELHWSLDHLTCSIEPSSPSRR